jgi:hypothetical protein
MTIEFKSFHEKGKAPKKSCLVVSWLWRFNKIVLWNISQCQCKKVKLNTSINEFILWNIFMECLLSICVNKTLFYLFVFWGYFQKNLSVFGISEEWLYHSSFWRRNKHEKTLVDHHSKDLNIIFFTNGIATILVSISVGSLWCQLQKLKLVKKRLLENNQSIFARFVPKHAKCLLKKHKIYKFRIEHGWWISDIRYFYIPTVQNLFSKPV